MFNLPELHNYGFKYEDSIDSILHCNYDLNLYLKCVISSSEYLRKMIVEAAKLTLRSTLEILHYLKSRLQFSSRISSCKTIFLGGITNFNLGPKFIVICYKIDNIILNKANWIFIFYWIAKITTKKVSLMSRVILN